MIPEVLSALWRNAQSGHQVQAEYAQIRFKAALVKIGGIMTTRTS